MRTMISDLPRDLIEEILSKIPKKSTKKVRLTCKNWESLSKTQSMYLREGESQKLVIVDYNLYLISIFVDDVDHPSTELKGKLTCLDEQVKVVRVFHCEGLLLCILKSDNRFVVWNPYCGEPRWIQPRHCERYCFYMYALGYVNYKDESCGRSYKILRFLESEIFEKLSRYEIYDFDSDSWKTLDVTRRWSISSSQHGVSLKGNTYWCATIRWSRGFNDHIICFDFTREKFGPLLCLPFVVRYPDYVTLSCVREEKLAFSQTHKDTNEIEIWITTKIETKNILWCKFLKLKLNREPHTNTALSFTSRSFFINEEKKIAIGFSKDFIILIGEDGYYRKLELGCHVDQAYWPFVCSYVPSLVRIKQPKRGKRKRNNILEEQRYDEKMSRFATLFHKA